MIRLIGLAPLLALGACAETDPPKPLPPMPGKCVAEGAQRLIGKTQSEGVAGEAKTRSGANAVRWIRPGMLVTMEFRADRVNLRLGPDGKITQVTCG